MFLDIESCENLIKSVKWVNVGSKQGGTQVKIIWTQNHDYILGKNEVKDNFTPNLSCNLT